MTAKKTDILVIGAGQAGLTMGYYLQSGGYDFHIVDGASRLGDSWRQRYDSLVLFTPRRYNALPGMAMPGDRDGYPGKDETADYLEGYARHLRLPLSLGTTVSSLKKTDGGFRTVAGEDTVFQSLMVVLATGAFQDPVILPCASAFAPEVTQLTCKTYRNPSQLSPGTTLVAGDGATGRQIAKEVAECAPVVLATGRPRHVSPAKILGRSIFWWMDVLGILNPTRESWLGRDYMTKDYFTGSEYQLEALRRTGVRTVGRLLDARGGTAMFAGGGTAEVANVIWALGYRNNTAWIDVPGLVGEDGRFTHYRGVSPVSGLFLVGQEWQWTRASATLHSAAWKDAEYLLEHIQRCIETARPMKKTPG